MANTRVLGEAIQAINEDRYVRVKNVGILLLTEVKHRRTRRSRLDKEEKK